MKESLNTQERINAAQAYEAPQVEIIEVQVEKGYANSVEALEEEEWN